MWLCRELREVRRPRSGQEVDERAIVLLALHRQDPLDDGAVLGHLEGGVLEERVDRREPGISRSRRIATVLLDVVQKRADRRRVEVVQCERRRRLLQVLLCEGQQQAEGVAIALYRMRTCPTLAQEMVHEECLKQRRESRGGLHGDVLSRSRSDMARLINSGTAVRYQ